MFVRYRVFRMEKKDYYINNNSSKQSIVNNNSQTKNLLPVTCEVHYPNARRLRGNSEKSNLVTFLRSLKKETSSPFTCNLLRQCARVGSQRERVISLRYNSRFRLQQPRQ